MKFINYNLKKEVKEGLAKIKFFTPTPIQEQVIPRLLTTESLIVKSDTGSGKTHAFLIPILEKIDLEVKNIQAIILTPTRELANQIYDEVFKFLEFMNIDVRLYVGGTDRNQEIKRLEKTQPQIVIGTLGKLKDLAVVENVLKLHTAKMVVIDEADMVFADKEIVDIDKIFSKFDENVQISVFSATIPNALVHFINKYLNKCDFIDQSTNSLIKTSIKHAFIPTKNKNKFELIVNILNSFDPYLVLIFANTKEKVDELSDYLSENGFKIAKVTGDLQSRERKQILKRIKDGQYKYVVASDIASRGLDIVGVSHVINFELPSDIEFFIHRVGRTARYNQEGTAISFYDYEDDVYINKLRQKGLKCAYMDFKGGVLVNTNLRNRNTKSPKVKKIEEEVHLKTPTPKKVKPGYRKKRLAEINKTLKKMKRKKIDELYHKKRKKEND